MKKLIATSIFTFLAVVAASGRSSILDIKHSITDPNVVPPESFEIKTRELSENFYLNKFAARSDNSREARLGTPEEYQAGLSALPTEIEMPYNSIVGKFIDMYLGKRKGLVADMLALHNYYGNIFAEELLKEKMPLELQYLPVIESAIDPNAVSRAGATGLWQFMPATATGLGLEINSLVDQRRDPRLSSHYAVRYLKQLYDIYGEWSLAIAAYNCGPGNVNKALRRAGGGKKDFWEIYAYLPQETRGYVPAFIAANYVMNYHHKHGIAPTVVKNQLVTDTVQVAERVHFNQIANILNIPIDEIRMLNPQFRKDIIPGDNHPYTLVLPSQQCLSYIMSEKQILNYDSLEYARRTYVEPGTPFARRANSEVAEADPAQPKIVYHTVARGENLRDIAKKYNVSATDIKRVNNLRRGKVKAGDRLTIEIYEPGAPKSQNLQASTSAVSSASDRKPIDAPTEEPAPARNVETKKNDVTPAKPAPTPKPATTSYTVKKGDTLEKIARSNGVTVDALRKANGMSANDSKINAGQKIKLPSKQSSAKKSSTKKSSSARKSKGKRRR